MLVQSFMWLFRPLRAKNVQREIYLILINNLKVNSVARKLRHAVGTHLAFTVESLINYIIESHDISANQIKRRRML
ncbi:hypothetical protein BCT63_07545 [Vibrio kanaloae]|nr:hypothetical protein A132_10670 [Vibrio kanaloae 5S-149]PMM06297.1 hypothetical protein BCT63_07545 [Vibrio kanaloae]